MRHTLAAVSRNRVIGWVAAGAAALAAIGAMSPGASAGRRASGPVPFGFVGVNADSPVWPNHDVDLSHQLDVMVSSGVDSVRAMIDWSAAQPYQNWTEVPADQQDRFVDVGGVPTDFTDLDALVALSAQHAMTLLPVVMNAPSWDGELWPTGIVAIPRTPGPYAAFVKALVLRYGSNGTFWRDNPQVPRKPIEMWQIWNEPNVFPFWPQGPRPYWVGYVPLLRAAHDAIKQADPKAKVVLAGLPNYSWIALKRIIKHGGRNLFDVAAIHPYTKTPQGVITILSYARRVLNQLGEARKPMLADEISWGSSLGNGKGPGQVGLDIATTQAGQAQKLGRLLPMLARNRSRLRLAGFYYYNWADLEQKGASVFEFSGLFHLNSTTFEFSAKPAYYVFRADALRMEHCRSKGALATECLH
jgi:hypothetical protein